MKNTFGSALALTIFGESHGRAIGGVLDGMAADVYKRQEQEWFPSGVYVPVLCGNAGRVEQRHCG